MSAASGSGPLRKILFYGLGMMGLPMASRLVDAGFEVIGFDPSKDQVSQFMSRGGRAPSGSVDFESADAVVSMLPNGKNVHEIYETSLITSLKKPTLLIDCSTIDVATTKIVADLAHGGGHDFIDAPVSGGYEMATAGTLSFMVGGEPAVLERARQVLKVLGSKIVHFGPASSGQAMKACNNMVVGINIIALSEGFYLARKLGLDLKKVAELWRGAALASWLLENRCPVPDLIEGVPSSKGYQPGFAAHLMLKDLGLSQDAAKECSAVTPFGAQAMLKYREFVNDGNGQLDISGIYKMYK